ncbi:TPA: hypothetical protein ACS724_002707, partial [Providencia alcalifaciens]
SLEIRLSFYQLRSLSRGGVYYAFLSESQAFFCLFFSESLAAGSVSIALCVGLFSVSGGAL